MTETLVSVFSVFRKVAPRRQESQWVWFSPHAVRGERDVIRECVGRSGNRSPILAEEAVSAFAELALAVTETVTAGPAHTSE
ncbi:hypothetical protein AB0K60_14375 [Thermopolyspora sp. NPDC052614]|uniref:hypothetical protein n=1 Tax=Thermopolyspora sp. NPDC052614 TaxID=3155682 RepID=UPI00344624CB